MSVIPVRLKSGPTILINECQVSSVHEDDEECAKLRMGNGDEWIIESPTYEEWENDTFIQK